ncbi:MAG: hypothetical protein QOH12_237 [Solirubrobacteraceae bacterium]|nr:hypothetical protein [Solirubrobacteraceae bacterium]
MRRPGERCSVDINLFRDTEVGDQRDASRDQNVARLQVAVEHAVLVGVSDAGEDVAEHADGPTLVAGAAFVDRSFEAAFRGTRHHEKWPPVGRPSAFAHDRQGFWVILRDRPGNLAGRS